MSKCCFYLNSRAHAQIAAIVGLQDSLDRKLEPHTLPSLPASTPTPTPTPPPSGASAFATLCLYLFPHFAFTASGIRIVNVFLCRRVVA